MERAFDVALILHADHELNASTFAARVTAATLSDIYSAVTSAIGALKGPLHGGANEDVIRMLLEAGDASTALQHVHDRLANKIKIPGFGHRVYRTEDPRATHLRALSEELGRRTGHLDLYQTSKKIEETMKDLKGLNANVDFYSASTYYSLGIPIDLFTPIFAVSRMSGWTAHILEQYRNNRLIRPRADYTGKPVGQPWVPIEQRENARHQRCRIKPTIFILFSDQPRRHCRAPGHPRPQAGSRSVPRAGQQTPCCSDRIRAAQGAAQRRKRGDQQAAQTGRGYDRAAAKCARWATASPRWTSRPRL